MTAFRIFLALVFITIIIYTLIVGMNHGWGLLHIFFSDMVAMTWPGQFNLDFFTFLLLSGLWVAWRNAFSGMAFALGVVAVFGGMLFLSAYLLYLSSKHKGDIQTILLGPSRV